MRVSRLDSKFGLGAIRTVYATPLGHGRFQIGGNAPMGAVFKSRKLTGEILRRMQPGAIPS